MAHYAKLNSSNEVLAVHVVDNANSETEAKGIEYLTGITGYTNWKQTSYNTQYNVHLLGGTPFRGNFATIGGTYDPTNEIFLPEKPYSSWTLDTTNAKWVGSVSYPTVLKDPIDSTDPSAIILFEWSESENTYVTNDGTKKWNASTSAWDTI